MPWLEQAMGPEPAHGLLKPKPRQESPGREEKPTKPTKPTKINEKPTKIGFRSTKPTKLNENQ